MSAYTALRSLWLEYILPEELYEALVVIDDAARAKMRDVLADIQSGRFAKDWMGENRSGGAEFAKLRDQVASHPIETVGKRLRAMMPWVTKANSGKPE